jgi:CheY-like chemotaxis protein
MTELALSTDLTAEQQDYLQNVRDSADHLLVVINDILDFSKIEAGKLELAPSEFALRDSLCEALQSLSTRASDKGIELLCHVLPDVPDELVGDAGRLRQIVINLAGNAVKFTARGQVLVQVSAVRENAETLTLHVMVADTGIGIATETQALIFAPFEQGDKSVSRKYGGTGLGLAISTKLVDLMGGRIWLESPWPEAEASQGGPGSAFHFTVRMGVGPGGQPAASSEAAGLNGLKALLADDNSWSRRIFTENLERGGIKLHTVESGQAAVEEVRRAREAGQAYDLLILDQNMPEMSGLDTAERLRAEGFGAQIVLLGSVGHAREDGKRREAAVDATLMKPVRCREFRRTLARLMTNSSLEGACRLQPESESRGRERSPWILVCEDNAVDQLLARQILEGQGHHVEIVGDGKAALARLAERTFDLILMDVQMPIMDGFETTAAIRAAEKADAAGRHVPILAMTAHAMKGDREECLRAGMDGYIAKPVSSKDVGAAIETVLAAADRGGLVVG